MHLILPAHGARRTALAQALREAVRSGRLAGGTRLPPYRALAADLGVARNVVAHAYGELVAEGWFTARQGSGTRVAEGLARAHANAAAPARPGPERPASARPAPASATPPRPGLDLDFDLDLTQGKPDAAAFPRTAWAAATRRALAAAPAEAFGPQGPHGRPELRRALAEYLARARGVRTTPARIVVCSGFANALRLLASVRPRDWAVEEYGLPFHHSLLAAAGVRPHLLPVDGGGARTEALAGDAGRRARTALLTPAHQFPLGGPMLAARRMAAVEWARASSGRLLVEDDYDGEFRYDRKPVGALQGLAPGQVAYAGSVSKSLSPALRLGWLVLPDDALVEQVLTAKGERESWASAVDQLTLAEFLDSGAYDRHVRRMRRNYHDRRDRLVAALATTAPAGASVTGISAGLHAVVELPPGTESAALAEARAAGLALDGLSGYRHPGADGPVREGLVVGYAALPDRAFDRALPLLVRAVRRAARPRRPVPAGPVPPATP
nr:PLP-dependent aminotransferase family protein [Streptomyces bambusae]